ncbi:NUDIX domain-containing protein [Legionella cardiaca]|uniref:ADP-ribose pyrophosphatase n=1 Tax=Legionella cardiaca TaxID=1071983 RepID=A0ABY8AQQ4_9GAMM|nr:NUDIX domain-containing protein [Legionella cardiaca]WED42853.1 NUDIX domain-containing protein [Legionella cardiaca]
MTKKIKCIVKENLHEGYLRVTRYDLEVPSLDPKKESIKMTNRELVEGADSILVLIYVPAADSFVFCQEFRIGVWSNQSQDDPFILECVSGTIDANDGPEETACKEVYEETGLTISTVIPIAIAYKSPGLMTEKCYLYYAELAEIPDTGFYGTESEEIKTQLIPRAEIYQFMDDMKIMDGATLIALNWFRARNRTG